MGINAQLSCASEKYKATRAMIKHNFDIKSNDVCHDIMERDCLKLPSVDLYTAGPPWQSFSVEGKRVSA